MPNCELHRALKVCHTEQPKIQGLKLHNVLLSFPGFTSIGQCQTGVVQFLNLPEACRGLVLVVLRPKKKYRGGPCSAVHRTVLFITIIFTTKGLGQLKSHHLTLALDLTDKS